MTVPVDVARPQITVVTVVFNGRAYLNETIESVLSQEVVSCEYWVIDGGSTDGSIDIIREHASRLAGWISEPDAGIADAFNKGLDRARGDYVMFLNADDALAGPRVLADLLACARAHAWPDVVYGDCDLVDPDGGRVLYRAVINYDRERFIRRETLPHPGMLMHRRYFERYGRFDPSYRVAMDYELFLRGVPATGAVRAPVLVTRVRAGGISARNRACVVDETIRALKTHGYLNGLGEARLRAAYAVRGAARRLLEGAGLYHAFDSLRRRRKAAASHA